MAKLNEGDVIEGIFTIALSLYLAYGKVDKNELNGENEYKSILIKKK